MSSEKENGEVHHGITAADIHYPVVAEGTGKTLDEAHGAKARQVRNAEYFAAISETNIERWSKSSIQMYFAVFVAFCCACANGYDGSLMGSIIAMKPFMKTFGTGLSGEKISIITSLYSVGTIITAPFAAAISDRYGRRIAMFSGGWVIIVGSIIACTSNTIAQLTVGRFVLGCGIAIMTVGAPAYAIEIAPAHWRGRCTGFYNCGWFGGSIPAAFVTFGCSYITNDWSWRIPLLLQCFACFVVIVSVFFLPESPRFHMANGKEEEAIAFLVKYHGNGDPSSRLVMLEVEEMKEGIKLDGIDKVWWDYRSLIMEHNGRWRFLQVILMSVFGQFSGNGLGYFNATIFDGIGIKTTPQQLGFNVLNSCLSAIGAGIGVALSDKMPRRKVLIIGTLICAVMLAINGGTSAGVAKHSNSDGDLDPKYVSYGQSALAFYFLFNAIYSFTYTPLQGIIPAEALDTNRRAKGLAASGVIVGLFGFINQFAGPIALQNIKYKYVYIFVAWDVVEAILWYFFCVETQGRTLEQLEWVYNQPKPVQASIKVEKVVVQADGKVTEKIVGDGQSA
ncbi:Lactose permease [Cytospora mali]|uniref:Lactose permease n=1 Tax=Cytospora mali TaxID=578113 RepID=A0A194VWR4_CYTMA|nr:Lactose permease [Valsa mali]